MNKYLTKLAALSPEEIQSRFKPDLSPEDMQELGVLAKQYYNRDPQEGNFFGVDASMKKWPDYWTNDQAPMGWYEWYQKYSRGERHPEEDLRQMRRFYLFKARHMGSLAKADPTLVDLNVRPRQRQALLNWGISPGGLTKEELLARSKFIRTRAD